MISVVICSINPAKFAAVSRNLREVMGDEPFEIIGIHDARSLAEGYNRGAAQSRGDILIFCHDDIEILVPDFRRLLGDCLQTHDIVGCVGTTLLIESAWVVSGDPYIHGIVAYPAAEAWPSDRFDVAVWGGLDPMVVGNIQALDGFFIAVKRQVLDKVSFDQRRFDGFHVYDTDFCFAAYLAGFKLAVCKHILIAHQSGGNFGTEYEQYKARFMEKYQGRIAVQGRNAYKMSVARNMERSKVLRLLKRPPTIRD